MAAHGEGVLPSRRRVARRPRDRRAGPGARLPAARRGRRPRARPGPREPLAVRVHEGPRARRHLLAVGPHQPPGPAQRRACRRHERPGGSWRSSSTSTSATRGRSATSRPTTRRRALPAGDYAVGSTAARRGRGRAEVTRRSRRHDDGGKLRYLLAELATLPPPRSSSRTATRRSSSSTGCARPSIAEGLGEAAARFPSVPIVFAETRPLAQEWTYRFLGAALAHHDDDHAASQLVADLPPAGPVPPPAPTTAEVRAWARQHGLPSPTADGCTRTSGRRTTTSAATDNDTAAEQVVDPLSGWRRRRESNPGTGLCRPLPQPLGHVALPGDCRDERRRRYRTAAAPTPKSLVNMLRRE